MKRNLTITVIVVAALALVGFAGVVWARKAKGKTNHSEETVVVTRRDMNATVQATGIIKAMVGAEVKVGSRISGVVKRLYANIGDAVRQGQVVAQLDDAELVAKLEQAQAAQAKAQSELDLARANLAREQELLKQSLTAQQQFDLTENAYRVAQAQLRQAQANVEYAEVQRSYATITAPISGVVGSVTTQEGEAISAGLSAPTFVSIIDLNRLEVDIYVDETDIGRVANGQEVSFTVDAFPDADFKGTVTAIYPKAVIQDNVVNYIVVAKITDFQERTLRPEMTANVALQLGTRSGVLTVPTRALRRDQGQRLLMVSAGNKAVSRPVKTGWSSGSYTEILSGANEGDTVVIAPEEMK
jgi:macrolide-specific efflux system membrane fusion protein